MNSELRTIFEQKNKKFKSDKEFLSEVKKVMAKDKFLEKSNEFYQLMGILCDTLNCTFDIFIEILINYASKAYQTSKKTMITQEFSTLLTQAFESSLQIDKKSKDIQEFDDIKNYCIQQFQNYVPQHQHTKKVGIFIEVLTILFYQNQKILKVYNSFKQKSDKNPQKILSIYQKMNFQSQRQDVEFRIQCFQALISLMLQRLIIKLDIQKRQDYYLSDEYSFIEYMLNQHKELYFVLIKSLEQTIKIQNEAQVHIIKAVQLFIVPFLTQDQFNFFQWWNNDQTQITIISEFINTFKAQAPTQFNDFTSKYPKLIPSHYHFNLTCCVLQNQQLAWQYFLNFKIQFDHDDLLRQCFLLKFRVGFMKSLTRFMIKPTSENTNSQEVENIDKTIQFKTKDKFHIFAKLCYILYMRMCNQEREFFRDQDCSQFLELIPYLGVFSLDLIAFNSMKILDKAEIEHISYKFHLYDKRAYLNQGLFELIKNMIFQIDSNPSNKVLLKITTDMIKKTIYKFPTQTIIFAQKFPLVVKNFYLYVVKNLSNNHQNVSQILFLLIFVSSMNKYTYVALIQAMLGTLNTTSQNIQTTSFTNQQEALFKELGLQIANLSLGVQTSYSQVVDLNKSLLAIFLSDQFYKTENLSKKIRQVIEDGKLILDFRFENFNYPKTYRKYARIALQYFLQDNGFTVAQYNNLQNQFDDLGVAMNKLTHRKSKFLEFFKRVYKQPEFLHYIDSMILWKDYQEYDTLFPLSRLYLMMLDMELRRTNKLDIKQFLLIFSFLCETILPQSFRLVYKNIQNFKEQSLIQFISILNQWINLNCNICFQPQVLGEISKQTQSLNQILQKKLNNIFFDELHNLTETFHTVKKILISP